MSEWPFLTADLPPSGGVVKSRPEDFEVEEQPAYAPSGEGEHLFLWVEKKGHDTPWVARELARALGLDPREVSYAGLKDRQAVTRQLFCVPAAAESRLEQLALPDVRLLWAKRHTNKLRTGHLSANRFRLRLRDVTDASAAEAALERLVASGVPNYFGEQRFGREGDNAARGKALLLGQSQERDRFRRRLFLSAYQSELFNRLLAERVTRGELGRVLRGDVLRKEDSGGLFRCEAPEVDQPRVDRFEVSPAGPMFGPKMVEAAEAALEREQALLTEEGLSVEAFRRGKGETQGARRPYRVLLGHLEQAREDGDLVLAFTLPAGSYATVVLRELTKPG